MAQARRRPSPDLDSYAPILLEDLLSGQQDWRPVPDIVRLSFKALVDVLTTQGAAIGELERQLPAKATKAEMIAGLSAKANVSDVTHALMEANAAWQKSTTTEVLELALKEKVSRTELAALTKQGISDKDIRSMVEQKVSISHLEAELQPLQEAITESEMRFQASMQRLEAEIKELCQMLDQKADQGEVEKLAQSKANRQSVIGALHSKAGREEVEMALGRKANVEMVDTLTTEIVNLRDLVETGMRQSAEEMRETNREITVQMQTLEQQMAVIEKDFDAIHSALEINAEQIARVIPQIDQKADTDKVSSVLSSFKLDISDMIAALRQDFTALQDRTNLHLRDSTRFQEKSIESRVKQIQEAHIRSSEDSFLRLKDIEKEVEIAKMTSQEAKDLHRNVIGLLEDLNRRKADTQEIAALQRMVSSSDRRRVPLSEVSNMKSETRLEMDKYREALIRTQDEITILTKSFARESDLAAIRREIQTYVRSQDLIPMLESKANAEDIKQTLVAIHRDIASCVPSDEFRSSLSALQEATEALMLEHCTARWLWTSGSLQSDHKVPWEVQTVNTQPDNFIWEAGQTTVYTVAPGLYELRLGIYTRFKPKAQILVNDQVLYRLGGGEGGQEKQWVPHLDGNLVGLTVNDVVALPTRARIGVLYEGEWRAEAFISLRKL